MVNMILRLQDPDVVKPWNRDLDIMETALSAARKVHFTAAPNNSSTVMARMTDFLWMIIRMRAIAGV